MDAAFSSETSISAYKTTRRLKPDDHYCLHVAYSMYFDLLWHTDQRFFFSIGTSGQRASDELATIPNLLIISKGSAIPKCGES
jgi:hypothetical protein